MVDEQTGENRIAEVLSTIHPEWLDLLRLGGPRSLGLLGQVGRYHSGAGTLPIGRNDQRNEPLHPLRTKAESSANQSPLRLVRPHYCCQSSQQLCEALRKNLLGTP